MKNESQKTKAINKREDGDIKKKKKDELLMQLEIEDDSSNNEGSVIPQAQNPNFKSRK